MLIPSTTKQQNNWHLTRNAYHEAGHAVVGHVIGRCIAEVSIVSDTQKGYRGYCAFDAFMEDANGYPQWQEWRCNLELITIMYAGTIALSIICEVYGWKYEYWRRCDKSDMDYIHQWASEMLDNESVRYSMLKDAQRQAKEILVYRWKAVNVLASALIEHKHLSGGEAHCIIRQAIGETDVDWRTKAWNIDN